jgi:sec-independent protein translocase protein TatC
MAQPKKMTFLDHLGELRKRFIRVALVLVVVGGVSLYFTPHILRLLVQPYGEQLKVIGPTESVAVYLRIALTCAAAAAMPYILVEIWGVVSPALMPRERKFAYAMIPTAFVLFLIGASFAWFLLIPAAVKFLAHFSPDIFKTEWTSQNYIPFVTSLLFWIGVCFELPLVVFLLAKLRVVTARLLLRVWRFAIVVIVLAAAVITPTVDPFNLMLVALPLIVLYFLSILLAAIAQRDRAPKPVEDPRA